MRGGRIWLANECWCDIFVDKQTYVGIDEKPNKIKLTEKITHKKWE